MTDVRYWIWLQRCLGAGARFREMLEDFGDVQSLYEADIRALRMSSALTDRQVLSLSKYTLRDTEEILRQCDANGWTVIGYDDARYPEKLRQIINPPAVLYIDGTWTDFDRYAVIGIVGTRKASGYGVKAAYTVAKGVSLCGAVVVSGGALGVDSAAHKGAIAAGAATYAVLGNGLGANYLKANRELRDMIKANGALVTEFPPFQQASKTGFPLRNRIISALSDGVLVTEAGERSGSMITVTHALEQGKDIWAVPCSLFDHRFYGTNRLIEDGAGVVTSVRAVLERYRQRYDTLDISKAKTFRELTEVRQEANAADREQITFDTIPQQRKERLNREEKALSLTGDEKAIYGVMSEELMSIETILENSGVSPKNALAALTVLEMKGLIESASGKRFRIK